MTGDISTAIKKKIEKIPCTYRNYIHVCVDRQFLKLTRELSIYLSIYLSDSDKYYGEKAGKIVLGYVCGRRVVILSRVAREDISGKVTFDQRLEGAT